MKNKSQDQSSEEYFDIVDENNIPTGEKKLRSEAHSQGLWHRTVHIYLFKKATNEIQFLVHLRAKSKDLGPNKWDTRFGGHLKAGGSVRHAMEDELMEELGLRLELTNLIQGETYKRDKYPNREFANTFYYKFEGETSAFKLNDKEVQEVKWMKSSDILESMTKEPDRWSGSKNEFTQILDVFKSKLKS